ncbi:hypothetical protein COS61_02615 [Candidatus Wolfebacteria bacterium CG03_land_8_20_14_0_80_40_12]|uniref:Septum formation initiator n=1 Tax=Candidatus Wolfebacteria bacterium CG03_land_8_20_14_0_80_40_12 TaxID=1975069 RepID=A0A2M7B503_9BACT|nr:MAG: hypothetical protein COS61_02615 [Candidatus Wolfebacteria bacterium CG03_land_8_20_14_0_80_40_12]
MRIVIVLILIAILSGVSLQIFLILKEFNQLKNRLNNLNSRLNVLLKENDDLRSEIEYFSHPENLEKELRSKFNYKKPGEEIIIITP